MARYKHIDTSPRLLQVDLSRQLVPGTFVHALNHLLDGPIDVAHFDRRFLNEDTGAPAYPPAMLLKVVLYAYSQGIVSSRSIERACREQVTFIALTGDNAPHFTTIGRLPPTLCGAPLVGRGRATEKGITGGLRGHAAAAHNCSGLYLYAPAPRQAERWLAAPVDRVLLGWEMGPAARRRLTNGGIRF